MAEPGGNTDPCFQVLLPERKRGQVYLRLQGRTWIGALAAPRFSQFYAGRRPRKTCVSCAAAGQRNRPLFGLQVRNAGETTSHPDSLKLVTRSLRMLRASARRRRPRPAPRRAPASCRSNRRPAPPPPAPPPVTSPPAAPVSAVPNSDHRRRNCQTWLAYASAGCHAFTAHLRRKGCSSLPGRESMPPEFFPRTCVSNLVKAAEVDRLGAWRLTPRSVHTCRRRPS